MKSNKNFWKQKFLNTYLDPLLPTKGTEFSPRLPSDYSPPTLSIEGFEEYQKIYSSDVNLTIRLKVNEFSRKQATLICGQVLYLVAHKGLGILDWMILEFLYSYLLGSKLEYLQLKNFKEFELSLLLKIVLLSGTWIDLEGKSQLPEDIKLSILHSKWVPNKRTYHSRENLYRLDKFLQVRIVPIDNLIERSKGTIRYSSYCKGYGESSHLGRRLKTRPSAELDGEPVDLEKETLPKVPLLEISQILQLVMLEIKYQNRK